MAKPFLKWAGGKRWFVNHYQDIFPEKFNNYIEPFLGSGAVYFSLEPKKAILGDSNSDLIQTYQAIKDNPSLVFKLLKAHHLKHNSEYYYKVRSMDCRNSYSRAARFIYLNRTCWNGLYRVNKSGKFNVPIGTKTSVVFDDDDFIHTSNILTNTQLKACDFDDLIENAGEGDFVFADPPYTVRHNYNGFVKYNEKIFSWSDQERLAASLKNAKDRGAIVISTNAFHESVKELYEDTFETLAASRSSTIASKANANNKYEELIILSENHTVSI